jgi:tRNA(His) 5'-end guanylyltransferase
MKAKLIFDLNDVEDNVAHRRCVKAIDMALALWQIQELTREMLDTSENGKSIDGIEMESRMNIIFEEHGINLDLLVV